MTATNDTITTPISVPEAKSSQQFKEIADRASYVLLPALALGIFLVVWQLLSGTGITGTLPGPLEILQDTDTQRLIREPFFIDDANAKGLGWQLLASLQRVALGYSLAAVVGVSLGVLIGSVRVFRLALDPIFQIFRTIPPLAWLPIALAILRDGPSGGIFVIFITAVWPIIINTAVGVQATPQDYKNVASVLKLSNTTYFFQILLPSAASYIFTGLRIAVGLAWLAIVAAEMLTGGTGIGFFIWDSYNSSRIGDIVVAVIYVGLVGFILDRAVYYAGKLLVASE
jgi:nitrate/nitrite transport system permease protein